MDDNACPHQARLVTEFLEEEGISRMEWPARSLDLNPIEHIWEQLQSRVQAHQEWQAIPQQNIQNLISSMHRQTTLINFFDPLQMLTTVYYSVFPPFPIVCINNCLFIQQ
uniref:Tc1-like transposase DDE domain-containing protein n=1 Tax=Sinocyclocheilus anshuiensis TaxID=1608454 RepID=A0A671SIE3_9TELE